MTIWLNCALACLNFAIAVANFFMFAQREGDAAALSLGVGIACAGAGGLNISFAIHAAIREAHAPD